MVMLVVVSPPAVPMWLTWEGHSMHWLQFAGGQCAPLMASPTPSTLPCQGHLMPRQLP